MKLLIILFLTILSQSLVFAGGDKKHSKTDEFIEKVNKNILLYDDNHWAGHYSYGDGLGENVFLAISPSIGFYYELSGCLGIYDRKYGQILKIDKKEINLGFESQNIGAFYQGFSSTLLPIEWGNRRYIIPKRKVIDFCNAVNRGIEPRNTIGGLFLLRIGDENIQTEGFPLLPSKYSSCLLDKPLEAEITTIGNSILRKADSVMSIRNTIVALSIGKKQGVFKGMEFVVFYPRGIYLPFVVTKVDDDVSKATVVQYILMGYEEQAPFPEVGWKLTTNDTEYIKSIYED